MMGLPWKFLIFFLGILLLPPRAGMMASLGIVVIVDGVDDVLLFF